MKGIIVSLPIWGAPYVALWAEYALPAMLAPGNLPTIARLAPTVLLITTNSEDRPAIEAALGDSPPCPIRFDEIGSTPAEMVEMMHPGHHHGGTCFKNIQNKDIAVAWAANFGIVFWSADTAWMNGGGAAIAACLAAGKRALVHVGYRTANPGFMEWLASAQRGPLIDVSPQAASATYLATNGTGTLPPSIAEPFWRRNPSNLRWSTGDGRGMLVRAMHANASFIHPDRGPVGMRHGTDHDLLERALPGIDACHLITDTTEHLVMGIEKLGDSGAPTDETIDCPPYHPRAAADYLRATNCQWHREWIKCRWWCQDGTLGPQDPDRLRVERESDREIEAILAA